MSSKLDIINGAYSKLRINGLTVNPTPELLFIALDVLEDMMSDYEGRTITLGYNFEDVPDVNSETGVDHTYNLMMKSNLAVNLIPDFGKQVPIKLETMASVTLSNAVGAAALINLEDVPYPNRMPLGSGNTLRNNQRHKFYRNFDIRPLNKTAKFMRGGDINDYRESFHTYLGGEIISTVVLTGSEGLIISNQTNNDEVVFYRVEAKKSQVTGANQTVKMVMTTPTGRVENRIIDFEVDGID